jgi:hypothetical protein
MSSRFHISKTMLTKGGHETPLAFYNGERGVFVTFTGYGVREDNHPGERRRYRGESTETDRLSLEKR